MEASGEIREESLIPPQMMNLWLSNCIVVHAILRHASHTFIQNTVLYPQILSEDIREWTKNYHLDRAKQHVNPGAATSRTFEKTWERGFELFFASAKMKMPDVTSVQAAKLYELFLITNPERFVASGESEGSTWEYWKASVKARSQERAAQDRSALFDGFHKARFHEINIVREEPFEVVLKPYLDAARRDVDLGIEDDRWPMIFEDARGVQEKLGEQNARLFCEMRWKNEKSGHENIENSKIQNRHLTTSNSISILNFWAENLIFKIPKNGFV